MAPNADLRALVNPDAAQLVVQALEGRRVLVTGASGWFGRTMVALLAAAGRQPDDRELLLVASQGRVEQVPGVGEVPIRAWRPEHAGDFAPEVVVNCAFPTREKVAALGHDAYVARTSALRRAFLDVVELPSVRAVVTISSGAALTREGLPEHDEDTNPYGYGKAVEESALVASATSRGLGATVLRAWAVSGPYVTRPDDYLFSSLVSQALATRGASPGRVRVLSAAPVWRRFAAVDEALAAAVCAAVRGPVRVVDTGGPLVEAGELADRVVALLAPGTTVDRPPATPADLADRYYADGAEYEALCREAGFEPSDLDQQVRRAALLLTGRSST